MMKSNLKWLSVVLLATAFLGLEVSASQAELSKVALILNQVGEILRIDFEQGKILNRTYIPEAYYSNKVGADPRGKYIFVSGGAQLMLLLDPQSLKIRARLAPEIPRRSWEGEGVFKERLTGFSSFYGGRWAITPDGNKIYFTGEVPELKPTIAIDPFASQVSSRIGDFLIYPHAVFSPDGKLMYINHRRTREIIAVDTKTDKVVKRISSPSEYDGFRGDPYLDSTGQGLLLLTTYASEEGGRCLIRVDVNRWNVTKVMHDPFRGEWGDYAVSSGGGYLAFNEYVLQPAMASPNTFARIYNGKINILNLQTEERKILSLGEKYHPDKWNFAVRVYMVPNKEKMLLAVVGKSAVD